MFFPLKNIYVVLIVLIAIMLEMGSTDILLPSLIDIKNHYHVSEQTATYLISVNLLGLAFSGIVYGRLSDSIGRRKAYLTGITLFFFGSLLCVLSFSLWGLVLARFIQGLGGGAFATVGLAILKDISDEKSYIKSMSWMGVVFSASPALFPIIGSYLSILYGWRSMFYFILSGSIVVLWIIYKYVPESNVNRSKVPCTISGFFKAYFNLLSNLSFVSYSFISVFAFAGIWGYLSVFPFLITDLYDCNALDFGKLIFINVAAGGIASYIQNKLVAHKNPSHLLSIGILLLIVCSVGFLLKYNFSNYVSLFDVMFLTSIYWASTPFIFSNASALALKQFPEDTGSAASLIVSFELLLGSVAVFLTSNNYNQSVSVLVYATIYITIFICLLRLVARVLKKSTCLNYKRDFQKNV